MCDMGSVTYGLGISALESALGPVFDCVDRELVPALDIMFVFKIYAPCSWNIAYSVKPARNTGTKSDMIRNTYK